MGHEEVLTTTLGFVMEQRSADAARFARLQTASQGSIALSMATFAVTLEADFESAIDLSREARAAAGGEGPIQIALASAATAFVSAAVGEEAVGLSCEVLPALVSPITVEDKLTAFIRYLAVEAALGAARLDLIPSLMAQRDPGDFWRDHDFGAMMTVCHARAAVFARNTEGAAQLLSAYQGRTTGLPGALVGATSVLIAGCAAELSALERRMDETLQLVAAGQIEPRDYVGRELYLLLSYGLYALGDRLGAAHTLLQASRDAALRTLMLVDRGMGLDLLTAAALEREDLEAAHAWLTQIRELRHFRACAPSVERAEGRMALAEGRVEDAVAHAREAERLATAEMRAAEAAEATLLLSQALITSGAVAEASEVLGRVVAVGDLTGNDAIRQSASRTLRAGGRRLKPVHGGGWDVLSTRERQVAEMLIAGAETDEVAAVLVLSQATVRVHISRVLAAFGVASRIGLVAVTTPKPAAAQSLASLTARQDEVAALVAMATTNAVIGQMLGISVKAVENHVSEIRRRLNVTSRFGIARVWWAAQA